MGNTITRRRFLQGTGAALGGLSVPRAIAAESDTPAASTGLPARLEPVGQTAIELSVNGRPHRLTVEPRATLAEVLRGALGRSGPTIACNRGACSACTVHVGGQAILACMLLAVDVGERPVVTIEGLADGATLHPVQAAFVEHDAVQCGFCTPGMVMSCAALLSTHPKPSVEEIRAAIAGHLCRCGTYAHVIDAVRAAAGLPRT